MPRKELQQDTEVIPGEEVQLRGSARVRQGSHALCARDLTEGLLAYASTKSTFTPVNLHKHSPSLTQIQKKQHKCASLPSHLVSSISIVLSFLEASCLILSRIPAVSHASFCRVFLFGHRPGIHKPSPLSHRTKPHPSYSPANPSHTLSLLLTLLSAHSLNQPGELGWMPRRGRNSGHVTLSHGLSCKVVFWSPAKIAPKSRPPRPP